MGMTMIDSARGRFELRAAIWFPQNSDPTANRQTGPSIGLLAVA
jgi:hypothetical protein